MFSMQLLCHPPALLIKQAVFTRHVLSRFIRDDMAMALAKSLTFDGQSHGQRYRHRYTIKNAPCGYRTLGGSRFVTPSALSGSRKLLAAPTTPRLAALQMRSVEG